MRPPALASVLLAALLLVPAGAAHAGTAAQPNVVVITTDDQRADEMHAMPRTRRLLGGAGTTFRNSFASYPLCCPSRATFLTGQFSHNHRITWNFAPFGGYELWRRRGERNALPVWLQRAGYRTGLIGKYLNEYGERDPRAIPPGWDDWQGSVDPSTYLYYGYTINDNGRLVRYGTRPEDYMTDVYAARAEDFVRENAPRRRPFFLWLTPNAPHTETNTGRFEGTPAVPPPRYARTYANAPLPRPPSFDEADVSDKPEIVGRLFRPIDAAGMWRATAHYRGRLGALRGADDMVARVVEALRRSGELANTLIVFTSDNGWLLGEHRVVGQKYFGFEESIRVPLLIRGPGFPRGRALRDQAVNVDLAPTILRAAGAEPGRAQDGIALQEAAARPGSLVDRDVLIETGPNSFGLPYYSGLRTRRYRFEAVTTGEVELFDLARDPHELESVHDDPAYAGVRATLARRLAGLRRCRGAACRSAQGSPAP